MPIRASGHETAKLLWSTIRRCKSGAGVASIVEVQPLHVAAIRHLFDWLVASQVVPHNPAGSVRGPSHTVRQCKTPVLDLIEARQLLAASM